MKNEKKKNNVISFPGQLSTGEREVVSQINGHLERHQICLL